MEDDAEVCATNKELDTRRQQLLTSRQGTVVDKTRQRNDIEDIFHLTRIQVVVDVERQIILAQRAGQTPWNDPKTGT